MLTASEKTAAIARFNNSIELRGGFDVHHNATPDSEAYKKGLREYLARLGEVRMLGEVDSTPKPIEPVEIKTDSEADGGGRWAECPHCGQRVPLKDEEPAEKDAQKNPYYPNS